MRHHLTLVHVTFYKLSLVFALCLVAANAHSFEWQKCSASGQWRSPAAQCSNVHVPVDHKQPGKNTLSLRIKKIPARGAEKRQLWIVAGGADPSTERIEQHHLSLHKADESLTIYALDHRGVSGTNHLACSDISSHSGLAGFDATIWQRCIREIRRKYKKILPFITPEQAALDLALAIDRNKADTSKVFIWGGSYGTYVLQLLMKLQPERHYGLIMEGTASLDFPYKSYDQHMNLKGHELLNLCYRDAICAKRFDMHPSIVAVRLLARLEAGHCFELGLTKQSLRRLLGDMSLFTSISVNIPAFIYRLERCNKRDIRRLKHVLKVLRYLEHASKSGESLMMGIHIGLSELTGALQSSQQLAKQSEQHVFSTDLELILARISELNEPWPTYPTNRTDLSLNAFKGQLLILHGQLDSAAPLQRLGRLKKALSPVDHHWVVFEGTGHSVVGATPTISGDDCGLSIVKQFLAHPENPLSLSCVNEIVPLDFRFGGIHGIDVFGVKDIWDG